MSRAASFSDEEVCQLIGGVIAKSAAKDGVTSDLSLRADLGIDSLGLMSIVFTLEEKLGLDVFSHVEQFVAAEYVSDIIKILRQIQGDRA